MWAMMIAVRIKATMPCQSCESCISCIGVRFSGRPRPKMLSSEKVSPNSVNWKGNSSASPERLMETPPMMTDQMRSEEHTSELQSLMRISYAVFCLKQKNTHTVKHDTT